MDNRGRDPSDDHLILYSVEQVAQLLGLGRSTVWRAIQRGELPAHHFARSTRISRAALATYVARHREPAR